MNEDINQKISQFLDDELDHAELDGLLDKLKKQPDLKRKINRYQVVTHALKSNGAVLTNSDFLDKINQEIKQEPLYFLPKQKVRKKQSGFWKKTSFAVAASIVCATVLLSQQGRFVIMDQPQQVVVAQKQVIVPPVVVAKKSQPSQHERLKAYLQAHNDDLYTHGSLNIHPLARVASYGQE